MNRKEIITRVLAGLIIVTTLATIITYFVLKSDKPWMAFYFACCGGILDLNFVVSLYLINRNIKEK
jgi:hypothetical protein